MNIPTLITQETLNSEEQLFLLKNLQRINLELLSATERECLVERLPIAIMASAVDLKKEEASYADAFLNTLREEI